MAIRIVKKTASHVAIHQKKKRKKSYTSHITLLKLFRNYFNESRLFLNKARKKMRDLS